MTRSTIVAVTGIFMPGRARRLDVRNAPAVRRIA
jgi:hypothetical protein